MLKANRDIFYHPLKAKLYGRVLIIFQGPVDYERRKVVENIMKEFGSTSTLVSDITFKNHEPGPHSPKYDWNVTVADAELADFYAYCRSAVEKAFQEACNLIVIDQSRIDFDNFKYYVRLAPKMQYVILMYPILLDPEGPGNAAVDDNIGMSTVAMETEIAQAELLNHLFCGWFLNETDSVALRKAGSYYARKCFELIDDFREVFAGYRGERNFKSYYNMDTMARDLVFCAVKIVEDPLDFRRYTETSDFKRHYGCASPMEIVGFILTPQTISARVKLNLNQRSLWEMDGDVPEHSEITVFPSEMFKDTKIDLPGSTAPVVVQTECESSRYNYAKFTAHLYGYIPPIDQFYTGSSCHIALGKSDGASPRNVDYDVPFAVQREKMMFEGALGNIRTRDFGKFVIRRIENYWFIYLKNGLRFTAIFATCCVPSE